MKNILAKIVENPEVNFILTALYGFATVYVTLVSIFCLDPFYPLGYTQNQDHSFANATELLINENLALTVPNTSRATRRLVEPGEGGGVRWLDNASLIRAESFPQTLLSLFALWALSQTLGYMVARLKFPPVIGMLLAGIIFVNASKEPVLSVHRSWAAFIRKVAFILCVIRSGIGLDPVALRRYWLVCTSVAIISASCEALSVLLISHFAFALSFGAAILFAYIMAGNSPAVIIPLMLELQATGRGASRSVPTVPLAGVAVDNVYCVMAYFVMVAALFNAKSDGGIHANDLSVIQLLGKVLLQLCVGIGVGVVTGQLLRHLPWPLDSRETDALHFLRALLLIWSCAALFFGAYALHMDVAAPVAVFAACVVAAARWKCDNHEKTLVEELAFKRIWDLIFLPLLFALTGSLFHHSIFSNYVLLGASLTLGAGLVARSVSAYAVVHFVGDFTLKEQIFIAVSFTPKATVQAVFLQPLVALAHSSDGETAARYVALACALSILVAAPLAHFAIERLGCVFLESDGKLNVPLGDSPPLGDEIPRDKIVPSSEKIT